jgi:hypothetical protein
MAKSEFLAEFAKLGPIKVTNHVPSGSPEIVSIALIEGRRRHLVIDGCVALKLRGVALPKAKNTLEALLDGEKSIVLEAPFVEDIRALTREMEAAGFAIKHIRRDAPDVKQLLERLGLTQEQFALSFGLGSTRSATGNTDDANPTARRNPISRSSSIIPTTYARRWRRPSPDWPPQQKTPHTAGFFVSSPRAAHAAAGSAPLAFSTTALKAAGSWIAISESTLRSSVMPALVSPSMKRL